MSLLLSGLLICSSPSRLGLRLSLFPSLCFYSSRSLSSSSSCVAFFRFAHRVIQGSGLCSLTLSLWTGVSGTSRLIGWRRCAYESGFCVTCFSDASLYIFIMLRCQTRHSARPLRLCLRVCTTQWLQHYILIKIEDRTETLAKVLTLISPCRLMPEAFWPQPQPRVPRRLISRSLMMLMNLPASIQI